MENFFYSNKNISNQVSIEINFNGKFFVIKKIKKTISNQVSIEIDFMENFRISSKSRKNSMEIFVCHINHQINIPAGYMNLPLMNLWNH